MKTSFRSTLVILAAVAWLIVMERTVAAAPHEIDLTPYANVNTQDALFPTFPSGEIVPPKNDFGVPFNIPADGENFVQFDDTIGNNPLSINVGVDGVIKVYTLLQVYGPLVGREMCSVEFIGSKGATQTVSLVNGVNIRDFFESGFAKTINNTSTRPAFAFKGGAAPSRDTRSAVRGVIIISTSRSLFSIPALPIKRWSRSRSPRVPALARRS